MRLNGSGAGGVAAPAPTPGAVGGTTTEALGGKIFATGGPVEVEVLPASAGITSELWLLDPREQRIATNRDIGGVYQLGSIPAGTELVFGIRYGSTEFRMGPASRNPDNIEHAVTSLKASGAIDVGFEDLFGGGDRDYDDNLFEFRGGVSSTPAPAPLTYRWDLVSHTGPMVQLSSATEATPVFDAVDDGTYTFRLTVTSGTHVATDEVTVRVTNVNPQVGAQAAPTTGDGLVMVTASITDPGVLDTHTADVDWGDGTTTNNVKAAGQGSGWAAASIAHIYNSAKTYTISVNMRDP